MSTPEKNDRQNDRPGGLRLFGFATLAMPLAAVEVPLTTYLPPLYASAFGFDLATLGLIFLAARLWDAFVDPTVGALSDRTRTRYGRRKPWILAGGLIFFLFALPIFFPPQGFGPIALSAVLFLFYVGYTFIAIPFAAWGGELSSQYHERTRITTYATVTTCIALLLALVIPALVEQLPALFRAVPAIPQALGLPADAAFAHDPRVKLAAMGLMTFILLLPALVFGLTTLKEPPLPPQSVEPLNLKTVLGALVGEKLLLRVLGSNFAVRLGQGIRTSLFVFFVAFIIGKPEWAPLLFLLQYTVGILAGPIWLFIGRRVGKHNAAVAGELIQVAINLGLLLVSAARIELLLVLTVAQGLAQGSGNLMLRAIVADVADHHRLKHGEDRTGLFFSVFSLSDKAAMAAAVGIALPLVAAFGFDPKITNSASALSALQIAFAVGPALAHLASALLIRGFPLDEKAHSDIRAQLDAQSAAAAPASVSHPSTVPSAATAAPNV